MTRTELDELKFKITIEHKPGYSFPWEYEIFREEPSTWAPRGQVILTRLASGFGMWRWSARWGAKRKARKLAKGILHPKASESWTYTAERVR